MKHILNFNGPNKELERGLGRRKFLTLEAYFCMLSPIKKLKGMCL